MSKIELLAPAGNRECMETALYFGADAVYMAGKDFGLRAFADNFTDDELRASVEYAHALGKRIYITVNAVLFNHELEGLSPYLSFLAEIGADGIIVSDPAVLYIVRRDQIPITVHLSTQANTTNYLSASFWYEQGIKRIVLSREVPLEDIRVIRENAPEGLEIEAFVHGAMCVAHSGRCLLSAALTGRSGNKGACAQPCRWEYYLYEKGYDGQYFKITEDDKGTYIMNSRDLMMIRYIPELIDAGITSFKIEGRMKSAYYVASVVSAYRRAIDAYYEQGSAYVFDEGLEEELVKSATRGFSTGFFFGEPGQAGQDTQRDVDLRKYTFVAKVTDCAHDGMVNVEQRNKFSVGETLEVLSPAVHGAAFLVERIETLAGEEQDSAPHPQQALRINCPYPLQAGDVLRRHN
ncbi:MAG: U32 family peptidase [Christensenella sp.]|uniref:peptidase U32 family protein n=1 Tax=Christensenella sp. TaxID=1935934 RepID=UPI002B2198A8|nr:U32 family peptidase [Christensenella sp.]MEA5004422.1 U32 family peptidase [Christensenella sp.]